jgi:hypothetical protein
MNYPINLASLEYGAYATCSDKFTDPRRDFPLTPNYGPVTVARYEADSCTSTPENVFYYIKFPVPTPLNTLVVRLFFEDGRIYTFHQFESTVDEETWTTILRPGSRKMGSFEVHFPTRLIKKIRMRATNTSNAYLHLIRFQAFNIPEQSSKSEIPTAIPVAGNAS